jgi:hypothetical protein
MTEWIEEKKHQQENRLVHFQAPRVCDDSSDTTV